MARSLLRETHPELFEQLVDKDDELSTMSNKKVSWRCDAGHEWEATVASRAKGAGCPYCSGRRRIVGVNDLATTHPDLAAELVDSSLGTQLAAKSTTKVKWRCEKGHVWEATPMSRTQGNGCPVCSNRLIVPGVNDLATTHPELAAQAVDQRAVKQVSYGSSRKLLWRCEAGHEWKAIVANRAVQGHGCPYCLDEKYARAREAKLKQAKPKHRRKRRVSKIEDTKVPHKVVSLLEYSPELAAELVNPNDARFGAHSPRRVAWRCDKGHEWYASIAGRVGGNGCPYCTNRRVLAGFNDLATIRPDIADMLVDRSAAETVTVGSHRKLEWVCDQGHVWMAAVNGVVRGRRCPVCANKKVVVGVNDLSTTHPELATELVDGSLAEMLVAGSDKKVEWCCSEGHRWYTTVRSRALSGQGCPYCSNSRVLVGFNDLATTHPDIATQLVDDSLATTVVAGSSRIVEWQCHKGHVWKSTVYNRAYLGTGCPLCETGRHTSKGENELYEFVVSLLGDDVEVLRNERGVLDDGKELDIVIPSLRIAIEFNGCFWHAEENGKGRNYHIGKAEACRRAGYRLIVVWEDTWRDCRGQVERMLATKFGVSLGRRLFARKTSFSVLDGRAANEFLEKNHIQGAVRSTLHFGLEYDGEIVAVMSVRSPKMSSRMKRARGRWDIVRYATSCHVVGGFSKLMTHAEKYLIESGVGITEWVSFSDNEVSDGHLYDACGFFLEAELPPDYKYAGYVTNGRRVNKESFQKAKFKARADLKYEDGLTERELAALNGLCRCWDCGKKRWVRHVSA